MQESGPNIDKKGTDGETYTDGYLGSYTSRLARCGRRNRLTGRQCTIHTDLVKSHTPTHRVHIRNPIRRHRTSDLGHEIEDVMARDRIEREGGMAWAGAGFCFQRRPRGEQVRGGVDGVDADQVGAQVGDQEVLLRRVEEGFVRVWRVLAVGDGAGARGEGVGEELGRSQVAGRGYVVGL